MKKIILLISLLLFPLNVLAEDRIVGQYGTYENAQKIIKEVMKSYYIRGPYMQYNYAKTTYGKYSPEEATSQDILYSVCAAYTYDVYAEAFGMSSSFNFPPYNTSIIDAGSTYYDSENMEDGKLLIYYENTINNEKYIYNDVETYDEFVELIKPGDLFAYTGHALIAYDVLINPNTGKKDILILNSGQSPIIQTRISSSTSKLSYNIFQSENINNHIDIEAEGTIKYKWLSESTNFVNDGKISCAKEECTVIRPFYENEEHQAVFNYSILATQYNKSLLRTEYPDLFIEKTVDKGDTNSVYLNDILTYTIKITNKSYVDYNNINYRPFFIEEFLDNSLEYLSSNGTHEENSIKWTFETLHPGETITLTYSAKVKNNIKNIGKEIISYGEFYNEEKSSIIQTGNVTNLIIARAYNLEKSYETCFAEKLNNYEGITLINETYKCAINKDFNFQEFDFNKLFTKKINSTGKGRIDVIVLNKSMDEITTTFKNMLLNNYWSGLVMYKTSSDPNGETFLNLPRWSGDGAKIRNDTINDIDFQNGDVLIYNVDHDTVYDNASSNKKHTAENGTYAYIYLNGKFIGKNYPNTEKERNEFTYHYYEENPYYNDKNLTSYFYSSYNASLPEAEKEYINYQTLYDKDNYAILRPTKLLTDIIFETTEYKIDSNKNVIYSIPSSVDITTFVNSINTTGIMTITNKTNQPIENNENIKTGYNVITIYGVETESPLEYKISIKGDTLGTGIADIDSAKNISKHIIDKNIISGDEYLLSADYNDDNQIKMNDVLELLADLNK